MGKALKVSVLGGGSWGSALAQLFALKGDRVTLWSREMEVVRGVNETHRNPHYLKEYTLDPNITATGSLEEAARGYDLVILATPSQAIREIATKLAPLLTHEPIIVNTSKGIEDQTLLTMHQVLQEIVPPSLHQKLVILSGPSFADEVMRKIPTAVTLASINRETLMQAQQWILTDYFRTYTSQDVIGVELGGALKNVIAIAAGISDGLGFGNNSRAALVTRGLNEIARLGKCMGANPMTFLGLSGMGDLTLTCTGDLSRNRYVGIKLGQGMKLGEITATLTTVAEGIQTAKSAYLLARKMGVEMVICEKVYEILFKNADARRVVAEIMNRTPKGEFDWLD